MPQQQHHAAVAARWLGVAGVLPFAACAVNLHIGWPLFNGFAVQIFIVYSAVVLSFMGGIRWGLAARHATATTGDYVLAVMPSLIAVAAVLLPRPAWQVLMLATGFAAIGALDHWRPAAGMPDWLRALHLQLTTLVLLTHLLAWLAIRTW